MRALEIPPFRPPFWARDGHTQTIVAHLAPSPRLAEPGQRHEIALPDGDRLVARWHPAQDPASDTVICLFHGLAGSSDSDYIHRSARVALSLGHAVLRMNHRGCGEGRGLAQLPYHSGRAEDLSSGLELARSLAPGKRLLAVGFSLSGAALLLLLGGRRGTRQPDCAIAVNAPIQLEAAALRLKQGLNRIYDTRFVSLCRQDVDLAIPRWSTLHDFDRLYTAPRGGFESREHYYRSCSSAPGLADIRKPTLLLTSEDDPFVPVEDYLKARLSASVQLHLERFGGHMGYLSAQTTPLGTRRWLDHALQEGIRFLARRN